LLQVFTNLVGNALKFTETGGKVAIRAYLLLNDGSSGSNHHAKPFLRPPTDAIAEPSLTDSETDFQQVRIEVTDTGIGIDADDQAAIFDRFFRVENRVHTLEGTGLGLSIVRNIIEKHRSRVRLVSEVGVGTTFWFDLKVFREEALVEHVDIDHAHQQDEGLVAIDTNLALEAKANPVTA
ncbi:MAG: hypothetical protein H7Z11_12135, partial [Verrucomicrobia bacterium]|nr:hypothetical protein [Leptolyngbya sp. ES-bin-22]